jgi:sporulation protein YlmC with PRC-barrel domain
MCLVVSALLLAAPAFAQEPLDNTGSEPSTQMAPAGQMQPGGEPIEKADPGTAPGGTTMKGGEPLENTGPQSGKQAATDAPAMIVITDLTEAQDDKKLVKPWNVPVDSVEDMDVYDANGKKIGEVDAVLEDKNGDVKAVAIGYGGFLGFGEKGAVVTLDQVRLKDGALVTEMDEEGLSKLPEWLKK